MSRALLLALGLSLVTGCFSKPDDDDDDDGSEETADSGSDGGSTDDGGSDDGGGSGLSPEAFAAALAEATCSYYAECAPEYLDFLGGDYPSCLATVEASTLAMVLDAACDYDPEAAASCLAEAEAATCDDAYDTGAPSACDRICSTGG